MHLNQRPETRRTRAVTLVALIVLSLGVVTMSSASAAVDPLPPTPTPTDQTWIVTLGDERRRARVGHRRSCSGKAGLLGVYTHVLDGFAFAGSADAAAALRGTRASPTSSWLARCTRSRVRAQRDPPHERVGRAPGRLHRRDQSGGTPVQVAIVDTGIKLDHVDLAANIDAADGANCINPGQPPNDDHGHGTHVAGTAAAAFNGRGRRRDGHRTRSSFRSRCSTPPASGPTRR